ncbi:MAG: CxxxxCH/CxxCH domain-containing protein [Myxococcales bacterium]|nr:MAG: CxxxxCH/CxxCH domain-containing protein [Myxococcales bacterium]
MKPAIWFSLIGLALAALFAAGCERDLGDGLPGDASLASGYHPADWAARDAHGAKYIEEKSGLKGPEDDDDDDESDAEDRRKALVLQAEADDEDDDEGDGEEAEGEGAGKSCVDCHGEELDGGLSGVSCNDCHGGWQNNCAFCHGGGPGHTTAAPPYDVAGDNDPAKRSVGAHVEHVTNGPTHLAYECVVCHVVPASLDSAGHLDGAPGAEVSFGELAGADAAYAAGSCSSVTCHGGAAIEWTSPTELDCASCHGDAASAERLGGDHAAHIAQGLTCADCHAETAASSTALRDRALHVNGSVNIKLSRGDYAPETMTCSMTCHNDRSWGGTVHPEGWKGPFEHGYAFERGLGTACAVCHGADLKGGAAGVSCDTCHAGQDAWRTNCVFCHGGADNALGSPPEGVFGETERSDPAVGAHTAHVAEGASHRAFDCQECHVAPASFADAGHIDQGRTPRVVFAAAGLNASGEYDAGAHRCASLYCHGDGRNPSDELSWTAAGPLSCAACHGDETDSSGMSGRHALHLREELDCADCHGGVVDAAKAILDKAAHIDGGPDVAFSTGTYDPAAHSCSSTLCHGGVMTW